MSKWPYPGDTPLVRARKVAQAYRAHLHATNPDVCAAVDDMARAFGETWAVPRLVIHDRDALLTAAEAADYTCLSPAALRQLRRRGRLAGHHVGGHWYYRITDLDNLAANRRRREVDHDAA